MIQSKQSEQEGIATIIGFVGLIAPFLFVFALPFLSGCATPHARFDVRQDGPKVVTALSVDVTQVIETAKKDGIMSTLKGIPGGLLESWKGANEKHSVLTPLITGAAIFLGADMLEDGNIDAFGMFSGSDSPKKDEPLPESDRVFKVGDDGTIRVSTKSCSHGHFVGGKRADITCSESLFAPQQ